MNETLRMPPFSNEAEQSVLGGLLSDPEAIDRIPYLESAHFYRSDHRIIFEEIQRQHAATRMPDPITVAERLGDKIENALQYLIQMRSTEPSGARIRTHADIVIQKAKRRAIIAMSDEMAAAAFGIQEPQEIADFFVGRMEALMRRKTMQEPQRMSSMMNAYVEMIESRDNGDIKPVATGLEDLDYKLGGGLDDGTLVVVAGRPAMGKTGFGLGLARAVAESGGAALFLSMEMPANQVLDRNVAAMGQVSMQSLRGRDIADADVKWPALTRVIQNSVDIDLFIDDQTALSMIAIRSKCRSVKRSAGRLNLVVIDQLSFITGSRLERRHEQVSEYTRGLTALAKELGCPVVLLCQLSRTCEGRPNKRPMLSDLAESGAIEQDADTIIFLYRDEVYNENSPDRGTAEIIIAKKRQGTTGTSRVAYIGEQTRFANLARNWMPNVHPRETRTSNRGLD